MNPRQSRSKRGGTAHTKPLRGQLAPIAAALRSDSLITPEMVQKALRLAGGKPKKLAALRRVERVGVQKRYERILDQISLGRLTLIPRAAELSIYLKQDPAKIRKAGERGAQLLKGGTPDDGQARALKTLRLDVSGHLKDISSGVFNEELEYYDYLNKWARERKK